MILSSVAVIACIPGLELAAMPNATTPCRAVDGEATALSRLSKVRVRRDDRLDMVTPAISADAPSRA